ncbi:(deoxy)nucleoside triphosphate pyrophosphohydrolase [Myroides odoratimimus]|uniref:(deoxy)nucleoside triphosphate pyrophosphohydrolase n=1 Tax=Myroides odoratimimus TaxID=76832 RepID=UPI0025750A5F|nr:(deoxy)nucleoside triphosphate pyrophosphohydrolase [Myroides odoratimimus]MDM1397932.1 (deoxy)nucleoside triphosphate pyrophosphohydrolase [Myroides odoratimimus]
MLRVTCAIIESNQKVLIAQRNQNMLLPYKWEFPGGKVEKGEQDEMCIVREIKEELSLNIVVQSRLTPVTHHYDTFSLELFPFICYTDSQEFEVKEHAQVLWVEAQDLLNYDWAEADIPIVKEYLAIK